MPHLFPDRRRLLQLAAASATTLWLPRSAWSQPKMVSDPFALGVASGSPTHDGVVLWTRLAGRDMAAAGAVTVRWEIADDAQFRRIVQSGQAEALPELGHSVHVEVQGLAEDRWYFFRFLLGGAGNDWVSDTGRTRTFPAAGTEAARLRVAYASCQRWEHGYFSPYRHMREEDVDVVMFLGDYIYEYPNASHAVRRPSGEWLLTLADYRARYALYKTDADLRAMHAACPWLVTWDDHEVQNDYAGVLPGKSGQPVSDFGARRSAAYQAWYEHMPVRSAVLMRALAGLSSGAEMRIYGQVPFGRLATLYLLDDRQYRDGQACTPDGPPGAGTLNPNTCALWNDPQRTLLGAAQEQWLGGALTASATRSATWNVLGQQSVFGRRNYRAGRDPLLWNDGWDGYPAARERFTRTLQKQRVPNPVLLGGDVHQNWVGHIKEDYLKDRSASLGVEFCGTSITSRGGENDKLASRLATNPHFVFADAERRGYGVAEFTPKKLTTTLRVVDDVTLRDTRIETLARFVVQAGRPVIEPA